MISCLVDQQGKVHAVNGIHSHSEIAEQLGIDQDQCLAYEFDLVKRLLIQDFDMDKAPFEAKASHDQAAQAFFNPMLKHLSYW